MVREPVEIDRIRYKEGDDRVHIYTPEEMAEKRQIRLVFEKALNLYKLALDLFHDAEAAWQSGQIGEYLRLDKQSDECSERDVALETEGHRKSLDFLLSIGRAEGWPAPEDEEGGGSIDISEYLRLDKQSDECSERDVALETEGHRKSLDFLLILGRKGEEHAGASNSNHKG